MSKRLNRQMSSAWKRAATGLVALSLISGVNLLFEGAASAAANAVVSGFNTTSFGGNDDGTYPCTSPDNGTPPDCTPTTVPIGFSANFFGTTYSSLYVNNNGNLTFGAPLATYTPFGMQGTTLPIIAPYFADVDTRVGNTVTFGTGTVNGHPAFGVNWPGVGCFEQIDSVVDNFQVILISRTDIAPGDFDIEYNYNTVQWDAGEASDGSSTCQSTQDPDAAVVGYSNGSGTTGTYYQLPGSQSDGAFLDTNQATGLVNNDLNPNADGQGEGVLGRYIFEVRGGTPLNPTTLTTNLSSTSVQPNTAVTDSAVLSGATATAGGSVTYSVYTSSSCTGATEASSTVTVTNGVVPSSSSVSLAATGTYYWQASYSGDGANAPSQSACGSEVETVSSGIVTTVTTSLTGGGQIGTSITVPANTPVTDSATLGGVSGTTGGTVTYTVYSNATCTTSAGSGGIVTVSDGSVPASNPVTLATGGTYYWQAAYSGAGTYEPSQSSCTSEVETVLPRNATTLTTSLTSGSQHGGAVTVGAGTAVTDNATLTGATGTAGGTVTYTVYSNATCTTSAGSGGTKTVAEGIVPASSPVALTTAGTYYWQASYSGDSANEPSQSSCTSEVENVDALTKLVVSPAIVSLSPLMLYVFTLEAKLTTVGGTPLPVGQAITFKVGGTTLCKTYTAASGTASCTVLGNLGEVLAIVEDDGYTATFAGILGYWPSSGAGGLLTL